MSFLEGNGTPAMVERVMIRPPTARIGPITPEERKAIMSKSPVKGKYDTAIDAESAYEMLQKRVAGTAAPADGDSWRQPAKAAESSGSSARSSAPSSAPTCSAAGSRPGRSLRETSRASVTNKVIGGVAADLGKSVGGSLGGSVGRSLVRGALGGLLRR